MSTPFPVSHPEIAGKVGTKHTLPGWLQEPLLHFVILGAVLFAVDHALLGQKDDPRAIVVGAEADNEAKQIFSASRGREPNSDELAALRQVWLDNEVLYREGLALQVDKGDSSIRERVIFKALSVVDANVKVPNIDAAQLRAWFEKHRDKYDEPARYDFQEAVLAGENSETTVQRFARELNSGVPGDARAGLRVFKGRPYANLVQSYGDDFAKSLEALPIGEWRALSTRDGWRAMRLDTKTPPKPAMFDQLGGVIYQDWRDATATEQRTAAVRALSKKYKITFEPTTVNK